MDPLTGLSRYRPDGLGIPPETEATHFTHILQPFAEKHGISVLEFADAYDAGELKEPELDEYFMHDRAVREVSDLVLSWCFGVGLGGLVGGEEEVGRRREGGRRGGRS